MIEIDPSDVLRAIDQWGASLNPREVRTAVRRTFAHEGRKGRTAVSRTLASQTGLGYGRVRRVLSMRSTAEEFRLIGRDGYTSLMEFGASQRAKGVSAKPWGTRRTFEGTFFAYGGSEVFRREGPARGPLERLYGPAIPVEMVRHETADAFYARVAPGFIDRLEHELGRMIAG